MAGYRVTFTTLQFTFYHFLSLQVSLYPNWTVGLLTQTKWVIEQKAESFKPPDSSSLPCSGLLSLVSI
jgi:hypothetical protein